MHIFAFVLTAVAVAGAVPSALEPASALVGTCTVPDPGFTWCYEVNQGGKCVATTTANNGCGNIAGPYDPDNDQASSATSNYNSACTLYSAVYCAGYSIELEPSSSVQAFSEHNFDNVMSSYRCRFKNPGFTWCHEEGMGGQCVSASTENGACVNIASASHPDNDKASSATTNPNSICTLYQHGDCGGSSVSLQPSSTITALSVYNFENAMSSYRCSFLTL
ncbi:hypothetical protein B0H16DRAFT_1507725 [Mycena metata]|uniref:Uncharacterized protein n=1 Tax=Mycena metata TaxID=1033252 RepID=A0AAD7K097_9AGAR|nr:hypothetical protein B0H16DRAFT_1507725 [Mycena metata]